MNSSDFIQFMHTVQSGTGPVDRKKYARAASTLLAELNDTDLPVDQTGAAPVGQRDRQGSRVGTWRRRGTNTLDFSAPLPEVHLSWTVQRAPSNRECRSGVGAPPLGTIR